MRRSAFRDLVRVASGFNAAAALAAVIVLSVTGGRAKRPSRVTIAAGSDSDSMHLPRVMLWAWERRQDLRFLDPRTTGVAFLAGTVEVGSDRGSDPGQASGVLIRPRLQPLLVPPGTALMAVIRVETSNDLWHQRERRREHSSTSTNPPVYSAAQERRTADLIASAADITGVRAVQVDYDAPRSEQPFYERVLRDVRNKLPHTVPLSVTALASWCIGDGWLDELPSVTINEAVPMLFRMGPDAREVATYLRAGNQFSEPLCRTSFGVSLDEDFSRSVLNGSIAKDEVGGPLRVYVFSTRPWTAEIVNEIVGEVQLWDGGARTSH